MNKKSSTELGIVETYKYDYFFHYSLIYYDELRLFLCQYLSHDQSITSVSYTHLDVYKRQHLKLTLIVFAFIPVMGGFAYYYNKKMKKAYKRNKQRIGDINARIDDNLSGFGVVKCLSLIHVY